MSKKWGKIVGIVVLSLLFCILTYHNNDDKDACKILTVSVYILFYSCISLFFLVFVGSVRANKFVLSSNLFFCYLFLRSPPLK
jgi:hypothetical protein